MAALDFLRRLINRMFPKNDFEKKLNVRIATSGLMDSAISAWLNMYENRPPWLGGGADVKSLNLPAAVAEELARLTLTEFSFEVSGSPRADFIQGELKTFLANFSETVELWGALGGVAVKPYAAGGGAVPDRIYLDVVQANRFFPTAFNSNKEVTGAVFIETKRAGDYFYTRLEHHNLEGSHYTVINKAYRSEKLLAPASDDDFFLTSMQPFLTEIPLDSVDEWRGLAPVTELDGVERPFFVYVKVPRANNIDPHSPLGASVFSRAAAVLEEADRQFSRILWEYKATEAAIDADVSLFATDKNGRPVLPEGQERLFRSYEFEGTENSGFIKEFLPAIRDSSLFNGLNELIRKVEVLCGLAYGTFSNMDDVAKTATEIKASKQRSYTAVSKMQKAWDAAFDDILAIMDDLCSLYNIVPAGEIEKTCTWGDGVLEDTETEYQRRLQMVSSGLLRREVFLAWYFGCTEEEAIENYLPEGSPLYSGEAGYDSGGLGGLDDGDDVDSQLDGLLKELG